MCGGTPPGFGHLRRGRGLSPRVRGNHIATPITDTEERSIPACAGEPSFPAEYNCKEWVYPRVCGGTGPRSRAATSFASLSPRVRGNLVREGGTRAGLRSIPACAGEPSPPCATQGILRVYPRVCGGTRYPGRGEGRDPGLSPRVRGNRVMFGRRNEMKGSIPACAGEPPSARLPRHPSAVYPRVCGGTTTWCSA